MFYIRAVASCVVAFALFLPTTTLTSLAQSSGWETHTPFRRATGVSVSEEDVWVSTTGGVYSYNLGSGEISRYTTTQGLSDVDARAVLYDARCACVWVGYADGVMDRIQVASGAVQTFLDIRRADQFLTRGINRFAANGDSLFVLTDFGLVVFDAEQGEVRDTYTQFADIESATPVRDVLVTRTGDAPELWVATDKGVAHAPLNNINLKEPSVWTVERRLPNSEALALALFQNRIYVGTAADAYVQQADGSWPSAGISGNAVLDFLVDGDQLIALESFSAVTLGADGRRQRYFLFGDSPVGQVQFSSPQFIEPSSDGRFWVADAVEGLIGFADFPEGETEITETLSPQPEGPFNGLFTDLVVDDQGRLWAAGARGPGTGFHMLVDGRWTDYTERFFPELAGRATYDHIHIDALGNTWAGSEGRALVQVSPENEITVYDPANSTLREAPNSPGFVRVRGIASEADGTLWVLNEFSALPLNVRLPDGSWAALPPVRAQGLSTSVSYDRIFVDAFGLKWILPLRGPGLIVVDTRGTPTDVSDDVTRYVRGRGSNGQGLPDENITAWAEDLSGRVWIGTERGLAIFVTPSLVLNDDPGASLPQWPITTNENGEPQLFLRDLAVTDIAVDPANQKWIASRTGVWLITADGNELLQHFTVDNSPLLSDNVVAVATNPVDGRVYFATDKGLVSWQGDATAPSAEAEPLFIYPNPARIEGETVEVYIDGLVSETDVRVLAPDGALVRTLEARGGRIRWDGRDRTGAAVSSGIYLVVAIGANGEGTAYGKVAIIR